MLKEMCATTVIFHVKYLCFISEVYWGTYTPYRIDKPEAESKSYSLISILYWCHLHIDSRGVLCHHFFHVFVSVDDQFFSCQNNLI